MACFAKYKGNCSAIEFARNCDFAQSFSDKVFIDTTTLMPMGVWAAKKMVAFRAWEHLCLPKLPRIQGRLLSFDAFFDTFLGILFSTF